MNRSYAHWALWLAVVTLLGCARTSSRRLKPSAAGARINPAARTNAVPERLTPQWRGRVDSVNARAAYIILSFPIGSIPAIDTRLNVYRNHIKVAEVKVTPPQQGNLTAADILAGECQPGDQTQAE